jgi:hypothetical protein
MTLDTDAPRALMQLSLQLSSHNELPTSCYSTLFSAIALR